MVKRRLRLGMLAGATCVLLSGCSGDPGPASTPETQATPNAVATPAQSEPTPDSTGAATGASGGDGTTAVDVDQGSAVDTGLSRMNLEPDRERYFQNGLNEAEIALRRKRNERRQKARLEAAEARKRALTKGNDAPVYDVGGGELEEVHAP